LHEHLTSCVSGRLSNTSRSVRAQRNTFRANVVEMSERHLGSIRFVLRVCHISRPVRTLRSVHCTMLAFSSLFCCSFSIHVMQLISRNMELVTANKTNTFYTLSIASKGYYAILLSRGSSTLVGLDLCPDHTQIHGTW
jgi:hypothetical protein